MIINSKIELILCNRGNIFMNFRGSESNFLYVSILFEYSYATTKKSSFVTKLILTFISHNHFKDFEIKMAALITTWNG
ncbi:hypothetical protein BpHYR1_002199 [Brachionus plicatilis]|uniref:Uncharacterized protein n=1 Tax=Brachionus plicatilis TaxID=10195 RepID=A0A3M7R2A8_BRAPC|nr:hypothetical protein BpHYR1_002199 [Brachionus plicatilis]